MNCEELKERVARWVSSEIECAVSGKDSLLVSLPVLKPNGDRVELGIESLGEDRWRLSDLGDTRSSLFLGGVDLFDEYVRAEEFRQIVSAHNLNDADDELSLDTSSDGLVDSMFEFGHALQSMLALQLTVKPKAPSRDFAAIIAKFLAERRVSFEVPNEPVQGKTGKWKFNFRLNRVEKETLVKTLTATSRFQALAFTERSVFEILDVREMRDVGTVVIADDEGRGKDFWQPSIMRIFEGWKIPVIAYQSKRQELDELAQRYVVNR
jgi:hypothetical protein